MTREHELAIAIPLYNEEGNAEPVATGLADAFAGAGIDCGLVLVNNGSTDRTGEIVARLAAEDDRIHALQLEENQGYGGGILAGLAACRGEVVGYTWGDGQVHPADHVAVYRKLRDENLDLCKARRVERHDGVRRAVMSATYNRTLPLLFNMPWKDINGCPKLMRKASFDALHIASTDWFIDPELMVKAVRKGLRVGDVPVVFHARTEGRSKVNILLSLAFLRNMILLRLWPDRFNGSE